MKIKSTKIKIIAFMLLFGALGSSSYAQSSSAGPISPLGPGFKTMAGTTDRTILFGDPKILNFDHENRDAILFYNPAKENQFTLRASSIEDIASNRGLKFTSYKWYTGSADNWTLVDGQKDSLLVRSGLEPGYHHFRVEGIINPNGVPEDLLCGFLDETFTVFVLPSLSITSSGTGATGSFYVYCESDVENDVKQKKIGIETQVSFVDYSQTPEVDKFEKLYRFYAIKAKEDGTFPNYDLTLKEDPTSVDGIELLEENTTGIFSPQMDKHGKYKIYVETEYTIKGRRYDKTESEGKVRDRPYMIFNALAKHGEEDLVVTVTPKPGKPHITIISVTD